jgi:hypothetical protein
MGLLGVRRVELWAYALIFASFSPLRWIQTLSGRGDELSVAHQWFGTSNRIGVAVVVLVIGVAPSLVAYGRIANQHRLRVWLGSVLLLVPLLVVLLISNRLLFGEDGRGGPPAVMLGAPLIVVVVDLIALVLLAVLAQRLGRGGAMTPRSSR